MLRPYSGMRSAHCGHTAFRPRDNSPSPKHCTSEPTLLFYIIQQKLSSCNSILEKRRPKYSDGGNVYLKVFSYRA